MGRGRIGWFAYAAFLAGYALYKYAAAAPPEFSADYAKSVAVLVILTGIAPFIFSIIALKISHISGPPLFVAGAIIGAALCFLGYAAFWGVFLAGAEGGPPLLDVAVRGIGWGALQGAIASLIAARQ